MLPEERAREKIDRQMKKAGWEIVSREEYTPHSASAVKEGLMQGNTESDYLLFVDDKAIAVVEAKREENIGPEEGKLHVAPGHQEIELALTRMYTVTGDESLLKLAGYFLYRRGISPDPLAGPKENFFG